MSSVHQLKQFNACRTSHVSPNIVTSGSFATMKNCRILTRLDFKKVCWNSKCCNAIHDARFCDFPIFERKCLSCMVRLLVIATFHLGRTDITICSFAGNVAHGCSQGIQIFVDDGVGSCSMIRNFVVYKARSYGIYHQTKTSVVIRNTIIADSTVSLVAKFIFCSGR